ncbi:MAG: AtpZ/AtpI family protein [Deltaproteobacteria bacterium]|nr:AtpZ/AtpI family protein [Deltaproteobacteria bacterium]
MWRIAGFTGAVGIEIAVAITFGYFGGQWLDRKLGTAPFITIVGFAAGVGAAIKALVRVTREYKRKLDQEETQEGKEKQEIHDTQNKQDPDAH